MENRTAAIIITIVVALLFGCLSLFACIFGLLISFGVNFNTDVTGTTGTGPLPLPVGITLLCVALIFILIPILVGFFTLRRKPASAPIIPPSEPLPPAI